MPRKALDMSKNDLGLSPKQRKRAKAIESSPICKNKSFCRGSCQEYRGINRHYTYKFTKKSIVLFSF